MTSSQILPPAVKPEATSLEELERRIRDAQAEIERISIGMAPGLSAMLEKAIEIGKDLIEAEERKMVPYRQRREHYKRCDIGDRTARRHKQLARLVAAKRSSTTNLTGLSIEEAIKQLTPPKKSSRRQAELRAQSHSAHKTIQQTIQRSVAVEEPEKKTKKHHDMIAVWMGMPLSERTRAIDGIGWEKLFEAIPESWHPLIAKHFTQPEILSPPLAGTPLIDRALDIPTFLQRLPAAANGGGQ